MTRIHAHNTGGRINRACTVLALVGVLFWPQDGRADDDSWQKVKDNGLVVCGVDGLLPYSSSDAQVPGFEVEIAQSLAKELGVTLKQEWVSWVAYPRADQRTL
jgi:polar amino acid transport system substrate-binding protein